jgi:hypothetical protein
VKQEWYHLQELVFCIDDA